MIKKEAPETPELPTEAKVGAENDNTISGSEYNGEDDDSSRANARSSRAKSQSTLHKTKAGGVT